MSAAPGVGDGTLKALVAVAFLGVIVMIVGFVWALQPAGDPTDVMCDGRRMSRGEVCAEFINGAEFRRRTYDQIVADNQKAAAENPSAAPLLILGGLVVAAGAIWGGWLLDRRRRPPAG
jgi:hypothetical protein